jgi:hypothetical protein
LRARPRYVLGQGSPSDSLPHHSTCRHHVIRGSNPYPVSVLKPFTVNHHISLAVFFNKFLAVDFTGAVIFIEKIRIFQEGNILSSYPVFQQKVRNICKKCNFFAASARKFLNENNLELRVIAKSFNAEIAKILRKVC